MSNNLTVVGSPTFAAGATGFGNAVTSVSDANYFTYSVNPIANGTGQATIEGKIKTTETGTKVLLCWSSSCWLGISAGQIAFYQNSIQHSYGPSVNDGAWHHIAWTGDGTAQEFKLFVDGTLVGTINNAGSPGTTGQFLSTATWFGRLNGLTTYAWTGAFDEIAMWTGLKYTGSYTVPTSPYTGSESNLVALYHLEADGTDSAGSIPPITSSGISASATTDTSILPQLTGIANGTAPYSTVFQWSTSTNGTYTQLGTAVAGANPVASTPLTGVPPSTARFFRAIVTDSAGTPQVVTFPSSSTGTSLSTAAENTAVFAYDNVGINSTGASVSGTTGAGHRLLVCSGGYTWFNALVTGTDCWIPSYQASAANDIQITVSNPDGSSPVVTTPTLATGSFQQGANLPVFTGLSSDTQKLVVIRVNGTGNGSTDNLDGDQLLKVNAIGTPSVALPAGYGTVIALGSGLPSYVGNEGGGTVQSVKGYSGRKALVGSLTVNSMKFRFKAKLTDIWVQSYADTVLWHVNRLTDDGSSGIPLDSGQNVQDDGSAVVENWLHLATGLDNTTEYLYEITGGSENGALIINLMLGGGTGINTGATGLVRTFKYIAMGDSTAAGNKGTNGPNPPGRVDLTVIERLSQFYNCQVINGGVDGSTIANWTASNYWDVLNHLPGTPTAMLLMIGINDVFGSESVATLSTNFSAGISAIRANQPTAKLLVEGIKPTSFGGVTYATLHPFSVGNGTDPGIKGVVQAKVSGGDANIVYADTETLNFGGAAWVTGGAFDPTNFCSDDLHPNPTGTAVLATYYEGLLASPGANFHAPALSGGHQVLSGGMEI